MIKKTNCRVFLCGPRAIYKTDRCICHMLDAWSWEQGHNVKLHIIYSVSPAWVRTDKKDMFVICYICSESMEGWESVKGREER